MKATIFDPRQDASRVEPSSAAAPGRVRAATRTEHAISKRFSRGSLICLQGDECDEVLVLSKGRVKLYADNYAGRSVILGVLGPGEIIGLAAAITGRAFEGTVEALESCEAHVLSRANLMGRIAAEQTFALQVARQLSEKYLEIREGYASLSASDPVIVRLARLLEAWAERERCRPGFTHQEIAEIIGTTRETVTRSFRELRCSGIVTLKSGELVIHDRARLAMLAATGKPSGVL